MATQGDIIEQLTRYERLLEVAPLSIEEDLSVLTELIRQASNVDTGDPDDLQALADAAYAAKAARVSAMTRDLSELLPELVPVLKPKLAAAAQAGRLALHPPCTLQHAQKLKGGLEAGLRAMGFTVALPADSHLCCGSAGTYSVLQPALSQQLRERKQASLAALEPDTVVSANIGCITHLQAGCATPVRHWVEVLDAALRG